MVTRLKGVITKLIGPAQSSFIPGRLSTDNIIIVQEAVHSMRRKKGQKGWMMLKLDLEKAYDRIRWDFLEDTLVAAGLPENWVKWIMSCVSSPSMTLLWNGEMTVPFTPERGLRQGDPLSPYLFVLCMERLCHLIDKSIDQKEWHPIALSRGGPRLSHMCFADDLILFAEATVGQVKIIRKILETFCVASGQKVSLEKSKIFFSNNVSRELAKRITEESGIQATRELGKYLGMPVLHKRINKDTFGDITARVASRLAGWKGRSLSFAGRITLTKSVLSSLPVHTMSTILLPQSTLARLDQLSRSFLWGSTREKRRLHLIAWERICVPKAEGGLGIRTAKLMNKAMLAKLGWRVLQPNGGLWSKVVSHKYKVGSVQNTTWVQPKSSWSAVWRNVCSVIKEVVLPGVSWVIKDGHTARFWQDKWLLPQPIQELAVNEIPNPLLDAAVCDLWSPDTGWALMHIAPYVTNDVCLLLRSTLVDSYTTKTDSISWSARADGRFTVKSAYESLTQDLSEKQQMRNFYDKIWHVMAPERVRVFLWLVSHQVGMTNMERHRRHMSTSSLCPVCKREDESLLHILRDCPSISGIWSRLVPASRLQAFMEMSILEWLYSNLGDKRAVHDCPWETLFGVTAWWSWKWRCETVFNTTVNCRDKVQFLRGLALEVCQAHDRMGEDNSKVIRVERLISWSLPMIDWVKLNTDGASKGNPGLAAAGGVIRDASGSWREGFAFNIGICTAPLAELWGVFYGLNLAWTLGITKLEVEVDSELVVGFIKTGVPESHPLSLLVHLCYGLLSKDWTVRVSHVYREANRLADGLANYAFSLPLGIHQILSCPDQLHSILADDERETAFPRLIRE